MSKALIEKKEEHQELRMGSSHSEVIGDLDKGILEER